MSKKKQTLLSSLLFVGTVFLGLMFLEGGRAKTLPNVENASPASELAKLKAPTLFTQTSHPALTLTSSRTVTHNDRHSRVVATLERFQRSDGVFKTVLTSYTPNGAIQRVQTHFGYIGLGVFQLDVQRGRLIFTGPQVDDPPGDVEQLLRGHALFARQESVQGLTAIVWRKPGRSEEDFVEEFRAPELGGLLIKKVTLSESKQEVEEPTALERSEPSPSHFTELFSLPVDYSRYERRVLAAERTSSIEATSLMRALLERMRQVRPGETSGN